MTNSAPHTTVIQRQVDALVASYGRFLKPGQPYALIDFPDHSNVGDSAIWAGEIAVLDRVAKRSPGYVSTFASYDAAALKAAVPEGPILIHGGGNFGDLWLNHQHLRLKVMADFPDRQIVQLPQSIFFKSDEWVDKTAAAIKAHGAFHLIVRDVRSQAFSSERLGIEAELSPDSALAIGPLARRGSAAADYMALLRTDIEVVERSTEALDREKSVVVDDWLAEGKLTRLAAKVSRKAAPILSPGDGNKALLGHYNRIVDMRIERGLRMLSQGRVVITDRLHAHILSTLLGLPQVVLDNHYGKIRGYIGAWTSDLGGLSLADNLDDAVVQARALVN